MTPDAIVPLALIVVRALNGEFGEAARIAAIESMHKLMTDYIRESNDEPLRH